MKRRLLALPAALLLLVTACGGTEQDSSAPAQLTDQEAELYDRARDEPALTWYSSQDPDRNNAVIDAFLARYPEVEVTALRLASGELASRYSQEREAGAQTAGLVTLASPEFVAQGREAGWFEEASAERYPELAPYPEEFLVGGVVTTGISPFGIGYNTTLVHEAPADWEDLLAPEYRGQIIFGDPRNVPAYVDLAVVWLDEYGEDFLRELGEQDMTLVGSMVPGTQQLAAAEGSVALPSVLTVLDPVKSQGAPLDFVIPEVTTGNEFQTLLPTDGPSPSTAELLYRFLHTEEGQQAFNGTTSSSPVNAPNTVPLPANYTKVDPEKSAEQREHVLELLGVQE